MWLRRAQKRLLLLDYDGTLVPQSNINSRPTEEVLQVLQALCADKQNSVYIISGRRKSELGAWFKSVVCALASCCFLSKLWSACVSWRAPACRLHMSGMGWQGHEAPFLVGETPSGPGISS